MARSKTGKRKHHATVTTEIPLSNENAATAAPNPSYFPRDKIKHRMTVVTGVKKSPPVANANTTGACKVFIVSRTVNSNNNNKQTTKTAVSKDGSMTRAIELAKVEKLKAVNGNATLPTKLVAKAKSKIRSAKSKMAKVPVQRFPSTPLDTKIIEDDSSTFGNRRMHRRVSTMEKVRRTALWV